MKAIQISRYAQKLSVRTVNIPKITKPDEVLIKIHAAPVHPADIYFSKGAYGIKKALPTIIGLEGSGTVVDSGNSAEARSLVGKRVACMSEEDGDGTWAEYMIARENSCVELENGVDLNAASCFFVNPMTASGFLDILKTGGHRCMVQTVASSAVGKMTVGLAHQNGIKSINLVRTASHEEVLRKLGANYVVNTSNEGYLDQLKQIFKEERPSCYFDALGSEACGHIFNMLPRRALCYSYGVITHQMIGKINPSELVFGQKQIHGFWLSEWLKTKSRLEMKEINANIMKNLGGLMNTKIQGCYPLENVNEALAKYFENMSLGKVLLVPSLGT